MRKANQKPATKRCPGCGHLALASLLEQHQAACKGYRLMAGRPARVVASTLLREDADGCRWYRCTLSDGRTTTMTIPGRS